MPSLKPTRLTINVPAELIPLIEQRLAEEHYHSKSAYFIGLLLFDLIARSRHAVTSSLLSDPQDIFEKTIIEIVRDFDKTSRTDGGWFRKRVEEARRAQSRAKRKGKKKPWDGDGLAGRGGNEGG